mmetsp:Transcript_167989/g.534314  ORF Transcript_167989/g.534314 Transcript_167989/m.534314 type:complete len:219 (+) Transcript_167989:522-1178(+)
MVEASQLSHWILVQVEARVDQGMNSRLFEVCLQHLEVQAVPLVNNLRPCRAVDVHHGWAERAHLGRDFVAHGHVPPSLQVFGPPTHVRLARLGPQRHRGEGHEVATPQAPIEQLGDGRVRGRSQEGPVAQRTGTKLHRTPEQPDDAASGQVRGDCPSESAGIKHLLGYCNRPRVPHLQCLDGRSHLARLELGAQEDDALWRGDHLAEFTRCERRGANT